MATGGTLIEQRLRQGLFHEAAILARATLHSRQTDPWALALAAEALERTGHSADAMAAVDEVCGRAASGGRALARALVVRGVLELEAGRPRESVATLERARDVATRHGDLPEVAWSQLRLVLSRFELDEELDLEQALVDARTAIERSGEITSAIAMNTFASELLAKRGLLAEARGHLLAAQAMLRRADNPWLDGLVAIGRFCVSYLEMDFAAAEASAKQGLRLSRISGHLRSEFAATIDLAHVWIRTGRLDEAARMLRRASNLCDLSPRCRDCVRDGVAQLELARGNLGHGHELVDKVLSSESPRHTYSRVWGALTKAEMLLRQGLYDDCRSQCEATLAAMPAPTDKGLALRLRLVLAEALARSGSLDEAGRAALRARDDARGSSVGLLAELNRRIATVLSLGGLDLQAASLQDRAHRLTSTAPRPSPAAGDPDAGRIRDLRTSDPGHVRACARVLDRTASLFEAQRPELVAAELGRLIDDLNCCRRWAIVLDDGVRSGLLDATTGLTISALREMRRSPDVLAIELPAGRGATLAVVVEPHASLEAIETLATVLRISRHCLMAPLAVPDARVSGDGARPADESAMAAVLRVARRLAATDVPVLLVGETGVGKEWLATRIHRWSRRSASRFVPFNCAAVSREMIEAQLFGHRRGAFTGAVDGSIGVIRGAGGGTLLLDEVGEVPLDCQAKLLRFLESGEVHGVGEIGPQATDVRVIAATNRRAEELSSTNLMRADLFYRLTVVRIEIPPLRERREEIAAIASEALDRFSREFGKAPLALSASCRGTLVAYDWPGNVRQLINELRRASALAEPGATIEPGDLSPEIAGAASAQPAGGTSVTIKLDQALPQATDELERASIRRALELCDGRRDQAAALLGVSRKGLYLKCQRLGLETGAAKRPPARVPAAVRDR
jgi:DNA-binding NtrC family response regulator